MTCDLCYHSLPSLPTLNKNMVLIKITCIEFLAPKKSTMDYSMSAKRHMEHPHDIKAHGLQVARLGYASVCSLQQHVLPWWGKQSQQEPPQNKGHN